MPCVTQDDLHIALCILMYLGGAATETIGYVAHVASPPFAVDRRLQQAVERGEYMLFVTR